jgi:hypothetical protein
MYYFSPDSDTFLRYGPRKRISIAGPSTLRFTCYAAPSLEVIPFITTGWARRRKLWHSVTNDISFWWAECRKRTTPFGRTISDMWADYVAAWLFTASRLVPSMHFEVHVGYNLLIQHYLHRTVLPHILCRTSVLG